MAIFLLLENSQGPETWVKSCGRVSWRGRSDACGPVDFGSGADRLTFAGNGVLRGMLA